MKHPFLFLVPLAVALLGAASSCEHPTTYHGHRRTNHLVRVLMNHPDDEWTVVIREDGPRCRMENLLVMSRDDGQTAKVTLYFDVPPDQDMWMEGEVWGKYEYSPPIYSTVAFHLHAADDLNGGGWNRGQDGRGNILVIE